MVSVPVPSRLYCNTSARSTPGARGTGTGYRPLASARAQNGQESMQQPTRQVMPSRRRGVVARLEDHHLPEHLHRRVDRVRLGPGQKVRSRGDLVPNTVICLAQKYGKPNSWRALNCINWRTNTASRARSSELSEDHGACDGDALRAGGRVAGNV